MARGKGVGRATKLVKKLRVLPRIFKRTIKGLTPKFPRAVKPKALARAYASSMRFAEGDTKTLVAPVAVGRRNGFGLRGDRTIENTEMVMAVIGSVNFNCVTARINPGYAGLFQWLSSEAGAYQMYRFNHLRFRYEPTCPSNTAGQVILAPEYCVTDPAPLSESIACNCDGAVAGSCWAPVSMTFDPKSMFGTTQKKFVRIGVTGVDSVLCDAGRINVSTVGMADSVSIVGRLWVDYSVTLSVPQAVPPYIQTTKAQLLGFDADVKTTQDANLHTLHLISRTYAHFIISPGVGVDRLYFVQPGMYRITGNITYYNTAGTNAALNVILNFNQDTATSWPPPYLAQMVQTSISASSADGGKAGGIVPIDWAIRSDAVGDFFTISYLRVGGSPIGTDLYFSARGVNLFVEPI